MAKNYEYESFNKRIAEIKKEVHIAELRKKMFDEVKFHLVEMPNDDLKIIVRFLIRFLMEHGVSLEDILERD